MSQSSSEWRNYMDHSVSPASRKNKPVSSNPSFQSGKELRVLPSDSCHPSPASGLGSPHKVRNQFITQEGGKISSNEESDLSSNLQTSQLLASPSGPPPGMKPDTLSSMGDGSPTHRKGPTHRKQPAGPSHRKQPAGPSHRKQPSAATNKTSPDSLIHTDHTDSSESMGISIPYYNMSNYSQSVNTFSMLARNEPKSRSQGSGASLSIKSCSAGSFSSSSHRHVHPLNQNTLNQNTLNQVPPRFSQFILDQTTSHARSSVHHTSTAGDQAEPQRNGQHNATEPQGSRGAVRNSDRDISNSMESQATIFSTKPEEARESPNSRWTGISLRRRRDSPRQSPDTVSQSGDTASSLKRAKAVRYTGKRRSIRTYIRQMYYRLKKRLQAAFTFSAGPRRATSKVQMQRRKTLVRKKRSNPQNRSVRRNLAALAQISGPLENPTMDGAQRVDHLTADLKRSAGANIEPEMADHNGPEIDLRNGPEIADLCNERLGKYNHLSNYLQEQRQLSQNAAHAPSTVFSEASSAPPPPPHGYSIKAGQSDQHRSVSPEQLAGEVADRSHLQKTWKSYLANVVSQRIRLRQEVFLYQALVANEPIPDFFSRHANDVVSEVLSRHSTLHQNKQEVGSAEMDCADNMQLSSAMPQSSSAMPQSSSAMPQLPSARPVKENPISDGPESLDVVSIDSAEAKSWSVDDDNVSEFQKVLNRRSMLGDMLSYDSEEFDSEDSEDTELEAELPTAPSFTSNSASNTASSMYSNPKSSAVERYGTVSRRSTMPRRRNTDKSSVHSSSIQGSTYLMTRSPGVTSNLCGRA